MSQPEFANSIFPSSSSLVPVNYFSRKCWQFGISFLWVIVPSWANSSCQTLDAIPTPIPEINLTAQSEPPSNSAAQELELNPEIIENSPVLQRWLQDVPNVLEEIRQEPSFRTRFRFGYSQFPSTEQAGGLNIGVDDIFINRSGFTVSGDYHTSFNGDREAFGVDLRYYLRPLGRYVNVAPLVGYRSLETGSYTTDGVNLGVKLQLSLSRTGAADVSLTQSFLSPGSEDEVGLTTLSVGYALTPDFRLSADIQKQNSIEAKDSRVGVVLEWMP